MIPGHCLFDEGICTCYSACLIPYWWQSDLLGNRKAWTRPQGESAQTKADLEPSLRRRDQCKQFVNFSLIGNSGDDPRLLWQLLWTLFTIHRTCWYCINQDTVFQGLPAILSNVPQHPEATVATLPVYPICCIYCRVSCQAHTWARESVPHFQEGKGLLNWNVGDSKDGLRIVQGNPNVFLHILTPQGLFMITHTSASYGPCHRVNPFGTIQLLVQRANGQGSFVINH